MWIAVDPDELTRTAAELRRQQIELERLADEVHMVCVSCCAPADVGALLGALSVNLHAELCDIACSFEADAETIDQRAQVIATDSSMATALSVAFGGGNQFTASWVGGTKSVATIGGAPDTTGWTVGTIGGAPDTTGWTVGTLGGAPDTAGWTVGTIGGGAGQSMTLTGTTGGGSDQTGWIVGVIGGKPDHTGWEIATIDGPPWSNGYPGAAQIATTIGIPMSPIGGASPGSGITMETLAPGLMNLGEIQSVKNNTITSILAPSREGFRGSADEGRAWAGFDRDDPGYGSI